MAIGKQSSEITGSLSTTLDAHASTHQSGQSDELNHDLLAGFSANEHVDHSSVSVSGGTSLAGGGPITTNQTLTLVNDEASPGNNKVYGTDGSGVKGWQDASAGSGDVTAAAVLTDNAVIRGDGGAKGVQDSSASVTDAGVLKVPALGIGGFADYDAQFGNVSNYGMISVGTAVMGRTNDVTGDVDLRGAVVIKNAGTVNGDAEFVFIESSGSIRFAIPASADGNATYNPRSMLIAGPAPSDSAAVNVAYWQTNESIFHNLTCTTGSTGADLGVQNDLEVEGDIFADSIKESTSAAGVTIDGTLVKDGLVDTVDLDNPNHSIVLSSNRYQLENDETSPGNDKIYGTNGSGVKGWQDNTSLCFGVVAVSGEDSIEADASGDTLNVAPGYASEVTTVAATDTLTSGVDKEYLPANNGFESERSATTLAFNNSTREFSITPTGADFVFFCDGEKFTKTSAQTVTITDTEGNWYIYFNASGVLTATQTWDSDIIKLWTFVSVLYWDSSNDKQLYLGDNRYGRRMAGETHYFIYETIEAQYADGLALESILADQDGSSNAHAQLSLEDGEFRDAELDQQITNGFPQTLAPIAELPVYYRSGAAGVWRKIDATSYPMTTTGSGRAAYNYWNGSTWSLAEAAEGKIVASHILVTSDLNEPVLVLLGEDQYDTLAEASRGAAQEVADGHHREFNRIFAFTVTISSVLFQTSSSYTNAVKSRIRKTTAGSNYLDYRRPLSASLSTAVTSHDALTGLADDDHTQYLLVDGTRAMSDDLDMGTNAITNVGNVDGVDVGNPNHSIVVASNRYQLSGDEASPGNWEVYGTNGSGTKGWQSASTVISNSSKSGHTASRSRTGDTTAPATWADIDFGTLGEESDVNVIELSDTFDDRIYVRVDGMYMVGVQLPIYLEGGGEVSIRLRVNDTTTLSLWPAVTAPPSAPQDVWVHFSIAEPFALDADDYLTWQWEDQVEYGNTYLSDAGSFVVTLLREGSF